MNTYNPPLRTPQINRWSECEMLDDGVEDAHAYSATCNCDACFDAWLAMPPPDAAEQERRARAFSLALAPSGGGELPTDWPKPFFPDLDRLSDAELRAHSKDQRAFERNERRRGGRG